MLASQEQCKRGLIWGALVCIHVLRRRFESAAAAAPGFRVGLSNSLTAYGRWVVQRSRSANNPDGISHLTQCALKRGQAWCMGRERRVGYRQFAEHHSW